MSLLPRRSLLALAAMVDIAVHARPQPVAAKALAGRLALPPRHLETLLQALVRAGLLKGVRGPRGGYELARERRRISVGQVLRAVAQEDDAAEAPSPLVDDIVAPLIAEVGKAFLHSLDAITIDVLCERATHWKPATQQNGVDFTI